MRLSIDANDTIVTWIRELDRQPGWMRPRRRIPIERLRCHPDLCDRLESIAEGLPARLRYVAGLPVLIHPNSVIFAIAGGTSWAALRLPEHAHSAVARSTWGRRGLEDDWGDVDPWLTEVPAREGLSRLTGWCHAACEHARALRK